MTNHEAAQLAWTHLEGGRLAEARQLFEEVLKRDAKHAGGLHGMGWLAQLSGNHLAALDLLTRAAQRDAKNAQLHFHLAVVQAKLSRQDDAIRSMRVAASVAPNVARYQAALGTLLEQRGFLDQATAHLGRAVELDPTDAKAHVNLSSALLKLEKLDESQASAFRAIEIDPSLALAHRNLAAALMEKCQVSEAIAAYRAAIQADPNDADAHFSLGLALLIAGEFDEGWREHEWRWQTRTDPTPLPQLPGPTWNGDNPAGKRIFVHSEQGLGDSIQFARYLPMLADRGATVLLRCQPLLAALMRTLGDVTIVESDKGLPIYDAHIPLLSLARFFHTTPNSIPATVPYLHADPQKIDKWRQRLASVPAGRRIGLCWSGNPQQRRDKFRSLDPQLLAPLATVRQVQWISIQKPRRTANPPLPLHDFTSDMGDFTDAAGLMMNLDLILTVDTSIAHLGGALARPVWTVIPLLTDWRYPLDRRDTPWYPTMRLFRQPARRDWDSVIKTVAAELSAL